MTDDAVSTSEAGLPRASQHGQPARSIVSPTTWWSSARRLGTARGDRGQLHGKKTAIISKSLFGKAHTVMAEGLRGRHGQREPEGQLAGPLPRHDARGKFLNNWRMAELHAKEARPGLELEPGARVRPTRTARSASGTSAGTSTRAAHVGDRTAGDDPHAAAEGRRHAAAGRRRAGDPEAMIKVFAETTIIRLIKDATVSPGLSVFP